MVRTFSILIAFLKSLPGRSPRSRRCLFIWWVVWTWTASLLNLSRYSQRGSSVPWMTASRDASDFGCRREAVKWLEKSFLSSAQEWMELGGRFLYQVIAPFLRVVRKIR